MNTRLEQFLAAENITQAAFADKLKVARASVSHILSGRNKPGYDFLVRLMRCYPSLNIEWLISGQGRMYKTDDRPALRNDDYAEREDYGLFSRGYGQETVSVPEASPSGDYGQEDSALPGTAPENASSDGACSRKQAVKVIVFYDNGTFEEFGK